MRLCADNKYLACLLDVADQLYVEMITRNERNVKDPVATFKRMKAGRIPIDMFYCFDYSTGIPHHLCAFDSLTSFESTFLYP